MTLFTTRTLGRVGITPAYITCRRFSVRWWPLRQWAVSLCILGCDVFACRYAGDGKRYRGITEKPRCARCGTWAYIYEQREGAAPVHLPRECRMPVS